MATPRKRRRPARGLLAETEPPTAAVDPRRARGALAPRLPPLRRGGDRGRGRILVAAARRRGRRRSFRRAPSTRSTRASARLGLTPDRRETFLNRTLTFDDDVAEALYSRGPLGADLRARRRSRRCATTTTARRRTRRTSRTGSSKLSGLASGRTETLDARGSARRFARREQITRLVCVEGWSAVAWWGGIRFADLLDALSPRARRASGRASSRPSTWTATATPDPYYVSIDLETARHPQALLATHMDGRPLAVDARRAAAAARADEARTQEHQGDHRDRVLATKQPDDYWAKRGYSKYDGL